MSSILCLTSWNEYLSHCCTYIFKLLYWHLEIFTIIVFLQPIFDLSWFEIVHKKSWFAKTMYRMEQNIDNKIYNEVCTFHLTAFKMSLLFAFYKVGTLDQILYRYSSKPIIILETLGKLPWNILHIYTANYFSWT